MMGAYVFEAVSIALNNVFAKNSSKKKNYRDKPYLAEEEERRKIEHMTEEERKDRVEKIFQMLTGGK